MDSADESQSSYSQVAEDILLSHFMKKLTNVTYIDIGCCYPIKYSNTFLFYKKGGRGLCIDPNPVFGPLFAGIRERDVFMNCGIGSHPRNLTYYEFEDPVFNTFSPDLVERRQSQRKRSGRKIVGQKNISIRTLNSVLDEVRWEDKFGPGVDGISIDVENFELEVLAGIDFERLRPRAIVCETVNTSTSYRKNPIIDLMREKNYRLVGFTGHDAFFCPVKNSFA